MGYSQEHIDKTRNRIVEYAGRLFRKFGYGDAGIDKIMNAAGLTRGGFYVHFRSKTELFNVAIADDFDFTRQLRKLKEHKPDGINNRALFAIKYYLNPERSNKVALACTMASSAIDVSRSKDIVKESFENRLQDLVDEMQLLLEEDGSNIDRGDVIATISMCVGGLILSRACGEKHTEQILKCCYEKAKKTLSLA